MLSQQTLSTRKLKSTRTSHPCASFLQGGRTSEVGHRRTTGTPISIILLQRISVVVQRGNAAALFVLFFVFNFVSDFKKIRIFIIIHLYGLLLILLTFLYYTIIYNKKYNHTNLALSLYFNSIS